MKIIKTIKYLFVILIFGSSIVSCDFEEEPIYDNPVGLLPELTQGSNGVYNLLDPTNSSIDFSVSPIPSKTASVSTGELHVATKGGNYTKIADMTSFPYSANITLGDALEASGLTLNDVTGGDIIEYRIYFIDDNSGLRMTSNIIIEAPIVCPPVVGVYTINMEDSWGDGWQGGGVGVSIDGGDVVKYALPNTGGRATTSGTDTFTVPVGATSLVITYINDSYNSEVSFTVIDPNALTIADESAPPTPGTLSLPSTCPL